jgi:hypothetical protein
MKVLELLMVAELVLLRAPALVVLLLMFSCGFEEPLRLMLLMLLLLLLMLLMLWERCVVDA